MAINKASEIIPVSNRTSQMILVAFGKKSQMLRIYIFPILTCGSFIFLMRKSVSYIDLLWIFISTSMRIDNMDEALSH